MLERTTWRTAVVSDATPQIDTYAEESSTFLNAFSHVGGTRFSFPGILSGVTPMMYGGHDGFPPTAPSPPSTTTPSIEPIYSNLYVGNRNTER
ncbi:hypothetical protein C8039_02195 [Halogeometricum sp. wsp3]|nr:hypothetical protein C8039_02195 [Halogeometricum sp. wsp3]